ncbi:hypothetical protein MNV_230022 [Candidatus Methanoperedens nitroreducens]|uniref:Uncharacterized protein n=1 Tax=Candidatus Methanoperedens nitratireducens TaxID=1392998 RepID=A0A284VP89_9EURY|nr:hypothetical protein MNV_230022 [Candidatus Methanoperedens nitroreducens]
MLVGADKERIGKAISTFEPESKQRDVIGTGASERIMKIIGRYSNE